MARSSRYYPLALGVHRKTWEDDLDGRESSCGWDCERRICESSFFLYFQTFARIVPFVRASPSHQRVGSLWFDFLLSPFSYFLFSTTSFCDFLFSFRLPLASVFYHRKPIWERESLKVSSPLRHFRSVSPDARQTALSRTPRFFRLLTYSQL